MIKAIVGANWGDEGKGKITDMLAADADIVIRDGADIRYVIANGSYLVKERVAKRSMYDDIC